MQRIADFCSPLAGRRIAPSRLWSGLALASLVIAAAATPAQAADVGISIQFSQPGAYGRLDIGQYPEPQLIAREPLWIERGPPGMPPPEPLYLWVPPEHRQHWARHCRQYHACGHPVYFVDHAWYKEHVIGHPHRDEGRQDGRADEHRGNDQRRGREEDNHERSRDRE